MDFLHWIDRFSFRLGYTIDGRISCQQAQHGEAGQLLSNLEALRQLPQR